MSAEAWRAWDLDHCWHPFTQHAEWGTQGADPLQLVRGEGPWLFDAEGRRYFDGNSSIWTNIHGHGHPAIDAALKDQLDKVAHTSFLGFSHPGAGELAAKLCAFFPDGSLERVFYSDNGSTALEVAIKMAIQFRQQTGEPNRTNFLAFENAYHGDTMGASSLGGVSLFFERFRKFGFPARHVAGIDQLLALPSETTLSTAALVMEPLLQGVNEMRPWPPGMLQEVRAWCDEHGIHLILDEVLTGFGRTGTMFACQQEEVIPDFLCLAKGLTGGYLPLAATLTKASIFEAFLGDSEKTFYYGHSYTANQLACSAALGSLRVFEEEGVLSSLPAKISTLRSALAELDHPCVYDRRQCGLISGIELRRPNGDRFPPEEKVGTQVCLAARGIGLLTRPIRDTIVFLPPLCSTETEIADAIASIGSAIGTVV